MGKVAVIFSRVIFLDGVSVRIEGVVVEKVESKLGEKFVLKKVIGVIVG